MIDTKTFPNLPNVVFAVANKNFFAAPKEQLQKFKALAVSPHFGWDGQAINLADLPALETLYLIDTNQKTDWLHTAPPSIKHLNLQGKDKTAIDFAGLPNLESMFLTWRKKCSGFSCLGKLKSLTLEYYNEENLDILHGLLALEKLSIANSSAHDLSIINNLPNLTYLHLSYMRKLEALQIDQPLPKLTHIDLLSTKHLPHIDFVKMTPNLERLALENVGDIASLMPVADLQKLHTLFCIGSSFIVDKKVNFLQGKNLKKGAVNTRKNYDSGAVRFHFN